MLRFRYVVLIAAFIAINIATFKMFSEKVIEVLYTGTAVYSIDKVYYIDVWFLLYSLMLILIIKSLKLDKNIWVSIIFGFLNYFLITFLLMQSLTLSVVYASINENSIIKVNMIDFRNNFESIDVDDYLAGDYMFMIAMLVFLLMIPPYIVSRRKNIVLFGILIFTVSVSFIFDERSYNILIRNDFSDINFD